MTDRQIIEKAIEYFNKRLDNLNESELCDDGGGYAKYGLIRIWEKPENTDEIRLTKDYPHPDIYQIHIYIKNSLLTFNISSEADALEYSRKLNILKEKVLQINKVRFEKIII